MKLYQSKKWLHTKYWDDELSLKEIGSIESVSNTCILRWMKLLNIPRRNCRGVDKRINHVELSDTARSIIEGGLLGDWSVVMNRSTSAYLSCGRKYLQFLEYASRRLEKFGVESSSAGIRHYLVSSGKGNKMYDAYFYTSRSYCEFTSLYNRWYPGGKKTVPRDLILNPASIMEWFLDDGCLECRKRGNPNIAISTCGFTAEDVKFLASLLTDIGIKSRRQNNNTIYISPNNTLKFLEFIGPCHPEIYNVYGYKFDRSRRGKIDEWREKNNAHAN